MKKTLGSKISDEIVESVLNTLLKNKTSKSHLGELRFKEVLRTKDLQISFRDKVHAGVKSHNLNVPIGAIPINPDFSIDDIKHALSELSGDDDVHDPD